MPKITDYTRQFSTASGPIQTRQRTAADFGGLEARALQGAGQQVSALGTKMANREEQKEVSRLNAEMSAAQKDNAVAYKDLLLNTSPDDKDAFDNYRKESAARIDKVGENISSASGRNYFTTTSARLKGSMTLSAAQAESDMAGEQAVQEHTSGVSSLVAGLLEKPDGFDEALLLNTTANDNLDGIIDVNGRSKLSTQDKQELAEATIKGWARLDPNHAKKKLEAGEYDNFLGGDSKARMLGEVDQAIRAKETEAARRRRRDKEVLEEKRELWRNDALDKMDKGELTTREILDSPLAAFGGGSKNTLISMQNTRNKGKLTTNPAVFADLYEKIHLPDGDPDKIVSDKTLDAFMIAGQLEMSDLKHLRAEISGGKTQEGRARNDMRKSLITIAKSKLTKTNPMLRIRDPEGDRRMAEFQRFVYLREEQYREEKKPIINLHDPFHKDYLGNFIAAKSMQDLMKSVGQDMRRKTKAINFQEILAKEGIDAEAIVKGGELPKKRADENLKDYLKRLKALNINLNLNSLKAKEGK